MKVSQAVLDGLNHVRESGETNMFDRMAVVAIALNAGYVDSAAWVKDNPKEYTEGVFDGFEAE